MIEAANDIKIDFDLFNKFCKLTENTITPYSKLSQYTIILHLAEGKLSKEIAGFVDLSPRTVESRIAELKEIFDAKSQAHLVAILFRKGVLK